MIKQSTTKWCLCFTEYTVTTDYYGGSSTRGVKFSLVPGAATLQNIRTKRSSNSNRMVSRFCPNIFLICSIVMKFCTGHDSDISKRLENWKRYYRRTKFCEIWVKVSSDGYHIAIAPGWALANSTIYRCTTRVTFLPKFISSICSDWRWGRVMDIWGLWCHEQVSQAGISNCIPQNSVGSNRIWWLYASTLWNNINN